MRKVDPTKHEDRRRAILDAAVRCFVRHGFHGTSIAAICAEAKMSPGHLYHYFPSKEAIVEAMVAANLDRAERTFGEMATEGASMLDVVAWQVGHGSVHDDRTPLLFDMLAEAGRNPAIATILAKHSRGMIGLLTGVLQRGQDRGEIDPAVSPEAMAPVLIALADGAKSLSVREQHQPSARSADALRLLVHELLAAKPNGNEGADA